MIMQLLSHYTKSILKSLINQLCDISRCNTQSNLSDLELTGTCFPGLSSQNSWNKTQFSQALFECHGLEYKG